jgi:precorrin-6A/cobalt-precorrin-6A reductase
MTVRVLLLGGTHEARTLADLLADHDVEVVSSLAGRVRTPLLPAGGVRVGGFGGVDGLAGWLRTEHVDAVIDATHPFAAAITANAAEATNREGIPFLVLRRPGWQPGPGDDWRWVDTVADANAHLREGQRVFLATGRGDIEAFADRDDLWFLLRVIDPPTGRLPRRHTLVRGRGPFDVPGELTLLREHRIDVLVARDSGGDQTAAKLVAARRCGVPVVLARRPPLPPAALVSTVVATEHAALEWLAARWPV